MVTLYADNVFDEYAQTGVRADTSYIGEVGLFQSAALLREHGAPATGWPALYL